MKPSPSPQRSTFSKEWLIVLGVFALFAGMCAFLGFFKDKIGRFDLSSPSSSGSSSSSKSSAKSSSASSKDSATTTSKVYTAGTQKGAAAGKEQKTPAPQIEVTSARLVPYTSTQGKQGQMIMLDLENTGETLVTAVHARIDLYDAKNQLMSESLTARRIFSATGSVLPLAPGDFYRTPTGEGIPVLTLNGKQAQRVVVEVVRLETP